MFLPLHDANPKTHIKYPYVAWTIIGLNIIIWAMSGVFADTAVKGANAAAISYGFIPSVINELKVLPPEFVRLPADFTYVTYAFFHADFWHLAGNMAFLWVFADNVEDALGHFRFAIFYLLCAAAGAWLHAMLLPMSDSPLIGASGAAAGVVSAYLMLHPRVKIWVLALGRFPIRLSAMWVLTAWIVYQLAMFLFAGDNQVSFAAHIGGIVTGAVLVVLLKRRDVALFDQSLDGTGGKSSQEPKPEIVPEETTPRWGR